MARNIQRLATLIDEMIEFSRMEIRGIQLARSLFQPSRLVQECVASMQPQALARALTFRVEQPGALPSVWADRKRVLQALTILMTNAVKFSHEGGVVRVIASVRPDRTLALAVADEGIGIDPSHQRRVFDKFYQVDSSHTRRYEGAGIGLSIAKAIAEAHGGAVELESELGKGSTFTLVFPEALFEPEVPEELRGSLSGLPVLLAAEDAELRRPIAHALTGAGCTVREVGNGYEAVRLAGESAFGVILADEAVVEQPGSTVLERLRAGPATRALPIVVFRVAPYGADAPAAPEGVSYLAKPFTSAQLAAHIVEAVTGAPAQAGGTAAQGAPRGDAHLPAVVVVEEDPDLLEWLDTALRLRNVLCYCASNVRQAVEFAHEREPIAVFVDIDGTRGGEGDSLAELRRNGVGKSPVFALTGLRQEETPVAGVAGVLRKPFTIGDIMGAIQSVQGGRSARTGSSAPT